jgi:hypothetical protein
MSGDPSDAAVGRRTCSPAPSRLRPRGLRPIPDSSMALPRLIRSRCSFGALTASQMWS